MLENIENIRKNAMVSIKEKIKKNPGYYGYLHPLNKERQEDMKRLGFVTGYEFFRWIRQYGLTKNSDSNEYDESDKIEKYAEHKWLKEIRCCACDIYEIIKDYRRLKWMIHVCDKKDCTGYLCSKCYQRYDPRSSNNKKKYVTKCRNNQLEKSSNSGKGFIGEMIIAKTLDIANCNLELDNFRSYIDLYDPTIYKKIQVKTSEPYYGCWTVHFGIEHHFDTLFILCMDKYRKNVLRVYIIPESELYGIKAVSIYSKTRYIQSKWEKFRVDEKPYNETYHNMKIENCKVLKND